MILKALKGKSFIKQVETTVSYSIITNNRNNCLYTIILKQTQSYRLLLQRMPKQEELKTATAFLYHM